MVKNLWGSENFSPYITLVPKTLLPTLNVNIIDDWAYFYLESLTEDSFFPALPHASKRFGDHVFSRSLDEGK